MPRGERTSDEPPMAATGALRRSDRRTGGRRKAPTATVVLLVRHGATTTTGIELPGRAPGLHLSDTGRDQAEQIAARVAGLAGITPPPPAEAPGASHNGAERGDGAEGRRDRARSRTKP